MTGRTGHSERRGSVYLLVLGATMLVMVIGLTALYAVQIGNRRADVATDAIEARLHAMAALEMATYWMQNDPEWRANRTNGWWATDTPIDDGSFSLQVVDPTDGDLSNSKVDPLTLTCVGKQGAARHMFEVNMNAAVPSTTPALEAMSTAIHTGFGLQVDAGATLTVNGAPASTNGTLANNGTIVGDVEATSKSGTGLIIGLETIPATTKAMPASGVFATYVSLATTLPFSGNMSAVVLTPDVNTYGGGLDPDGVYYIDTGGLDLTIEGTRFEGTLVIEAPLNTVHLKSNLLMLNHRSDYPVLIVHGSVVFEFTGSASGLSEAFWGVNFNPASAPYLTVTDSDMTDFYPSEVDGLVHCTGDLSVNNLPSLVRGLVLAEGKATISNDLTINYDANLATSPPQGYTQDPGDYAVMKVVRGSWRQLVE